MASKVSPNPGIQFASKLLLYYLEQMENSQSTDQISFYPRFAKTALQKPDFLVFCFSHSFGGVNIKTK